MSRLYCAVLGRSCYRIWMERDEDVEMFRIKNSHRHPDVYVQLKKIYMIRVTGGQ